MTVPTFGKTSTAAEVLEGIDLRGRRALVTGVSAGMGVEISRALAARGADVVGLARDLDKARAATRHVLAPGVVPGNLELVTVDLASLASIREGADAIVAAGRPFDLLIANAGVMAGRKGVTVDGFETQFGTNYVGHFVLINRLAPLLRSGGRVIMVSSAGHHRADVDLVDPNYERTLYEEYTAYGRSKTATILFAVEFDRRHRSRGVRAAAIHPGAVMSETVKSMIEALGPGKDAALAGYDWKTVPQGAATAVWAGIVAPAEQVGARYCEDCHIADVTTDTTSRVGARSYALDAARARTLWSRTEEMVGERF